MPSPAPCRTLRDAASVIAFALLAIAAGQGSCAGQELAYAVTETAQLDGRDWDRAARGMTVDAVHRSVLLRFPGVAAAVKSHLDRGLEIASAAIALDYAGYELRPDGYLVRDGLGRKKWESDPPRWHVVAWPLRLPWVADDNRGPTFRARVKGEAAWAELGARDGQRDRFPEQLGPAELSLQAPVARIDVTDLLTTGAVAADLGTRLRFLETTGFLIQKLEEYDSRYRDAGDAYEWAVPTGGHGLTFANPRLIIRFAPAAQGNGASPLVLPEMPAIAAASPSSGATEAAGRGPAAQPGETDLDAVRRRAAKLFDEKPSWMSEAQFERARELLHIGGDSISAWLEAAAAGDFKRYQAYLRELWTTPPRYWKGWGIQDDILLLYQLADFVPGHIREHLKRYWISWLMPDIPSDRLFHPQSKEAEAYARASGDWRGRASFFRSGYTHVVSTQNFNHTATLGALLGGHLIASPAAMADGRIGLERLLLRYWSFTDGSSQEMLDHYYLSITLSAQKMLADFGPTAFDRLAGRIMLERTMEMLATLYHPFVGRFIGPSGRARLSGVLIEQDGIYGALHALSAKGVLRYAGKPFNATVHGMPVWGYDFPPGRVGLQSLSGPWGPRWFSRIIDAKPFPFEERAAETIRGNFSPPLWRTSYLGRYYGLASQDIKGGTVDVLGQWTRVAGPSTSIEDLGTLTLRTCINRCDVVTTSGGAMPFTGSLTTFQHKNRAIVLTRPPADRAAIERAAGPQGLSSLGSVLALWNFQSPRTWELYVDGVPKRESDLPLRLEAGQVLVIRDGPSYVGIHPLPSADPGGRRDVIVAVGGHGGRSEPNRAPLEPALTITSYTYRSERPPAYDTLDWTAITTQSFAGFAIELGDAAEYGSFAGFMHRMRAAKLEAQWLPSRHEVEIKYRSGDEALSARFATDVRQMSAHFPIAPGTQERAIQARQVNGSSPLLPAGLERDTSWSQQGVTGRLEKNGAVLETEPGRKAYLIVTPGGEGVVAYNPLPDPTWWQLSLPGGARVMADGKVGLLRVAIDREANTVEIDHAAKDERQSRALARRLWLAGFSPNTKARVNGSRAVVSWEIDPQSGKSRGTVDLPSGL
jgi:hypothetical protein